MPVKIWPEDRYREVVADLITEFDLWPVVFGGPEDRDRGDRLLRSWRRGYNGAGALSLRSSASALARCRLYLGNDSGVMHLAAAAGVPCVALFSARESPGSWYPYGGAHRVLRSQIDCEGCMLVECIDRRMECLMAISTAEAFEACTQIILGVSRPDAGMPAPRS